MKKKSKDFTNEIELEESSFINKLDNEKQELNELINQSPLNLSIALMKICQENDFNPLSIESYYQKIFPEMDKVKHLNGLKYKSKSITAVRSAILTNNLFTKNKDNLYSLNIKECIKYLKILKNKKNNKKIKQRKEKEESLLTKKRKNSFDINDNKIKRYKHVYELMENVLEIYTKDKELNKKIKIFFNKCSNYNDVIDKYKNNKEVIEGMLSMFNYFKPFLKKSLFTMDSLTYLNNLNSKIKDFKEQLSLSKTLLK